ncbi:MAG TPA: GyrI-like domain-containing protein [Gemmatimonadales bacterium]|nr:GyrI-like domain-containing protein [Gemmatimonadales bacterium]
MKTDLYRRYKREYVAPKNPALVRVGPARYLSVSGRGDPNGPGFGAAVGALYGVAFTIKMAKKAAKKDYVVAKLEGLWWGGSRGKLLIDSPRSTWRWKILIRVPPFVTVSDLGRAKRELLRRGKSGGTVRLESLREGRVVQLLHVGPYDREHESLGRMEEFARAGGMRFAGRHHEIYLSDPRRVAPARLRTILRRPVR